MIIATFESVKQKYVIVVSIWSLYAIKQMFLAAFVWNNIYLTYISYVDL